MEKLKFHHPEDKNRMMKMFCFISLEILKPLYILMIKDNKSRLTFQGTNHFFRINPLGELFIGQKTKL